jgi:hypothetical protein
METTDIGKFQSRTDDSVRVLAFLRPRRAKEKNLKSC